LTFFLVAYILERKSNLLRNGGTKTLGCFTYPKVRHMFLNLDGLIYFGLREVGV
jgi:hypothetical protein